MRFDKLTTKFQQAINDAQSLALGADNTAIEPQHLLLALLNQEDGGTASLLLKAGVQLNPLKAGLSAAIANLPKSSEMSGEVAISRDLSLPVAPPAREERMDCWAVGGKGGAAPKTLLQPDPGRATGAPCKAATLERLRRAD